MSNANNELPALPEPLRFAAASLRSTRPSDELARKVREKLSRAETSEPQRQSAVYSRRRPLLILAVAAAASLGLGTLARTHPMGHFANAPGGPRIFEVQQLNVQLPATGSTWVSLPWRGELHGEQTTEVHVEAPEQIALRTPGQERHLECAQQTCLHRWTSDAANSPHGGLHAQISHPGRYVFHVTHASRGHLLHDHFIVLAQR